jgi:hypothetical protein
MRALRFLGAVAACALSCSGTGAASRGAGQFENSGGDNGGLITTGGGGGDTTTGGATGNTGGASINQVTDGDGGGCNELHVKYEKLIPTVLLLVDESGSMFDNTYSGAQSRWTVLRNAIHESMHPPYQVNDPGVRLAIGTLGSDPLVADTVAHHDRSFGYNSPQGLIEEDSVEALEQIVDEQFGVGRVARWYWYRQDGGMHVLAPAMYLGYRQALEEHPEPYSRWLVRAVMEGRLQGAVLKKTRSRFFFWLR